MGDAILDRRTHGILSALPGPVPQIAEHPEVYRPSVDSALLCLGLAEEFRVRPSRSSSATELCAGAGLASLYATRWASTVIAVDRNPAAIAVMRSNARVNGVALDLRCADANDLDRSFAADVVFANPPYVPTSPDATRSALGYACNGGELGRDVIDSIIERAPILVRPGGTLLLVQSTISGAEQTMAALSALGFQVSVSHTRTIPFGPVMLGRAVWMEERGLIAPGQRWEQLVVIRARRR
ncbi:HemK2/MTQ2 family protein methyltransferase [Gordonia sp. SL306]|uniref:HemK2/MTQ2 family protein methyltransferase n=1 Tax=Gordonia sp. SL306 TaxID=2995145 RepID=UPI00226E610B|nr:HemK2/MTQ2 family protein methyltransferase [Gordonia sp. SL306]WAC53951.1 methyltransferase [Gordonia sp. SL306]